MKAALLEVAQQLIPRGDTPAKLTTDAGYRIDYLPQLRVLAVVPPGQAEDIWIPVERFVRMWPVPAPVVEEEVPHEPTGKPSRRARPQAPSGDVQG